MKEIHKAMAFRLQKANDLEALEKILNREKIKIGINDSFRNAIKLLRDSNHRFGEDIEGASNETLWGYNIKGLTVEVSSISGHFFPHGLRKIIIKVDINLLANYKAWKEMEDPLQRLDLNVTVLGYGQNGINALYSYHLDRHSPIQTPAKAKSQKVPELHPLYHFQFNSNKTHKLAEAKSLEFSHGPLFLDAPRIIHYPLDLVLTLDFLMANYLPSNWENLVSDGVYFNLCKQYQLAIWKPFIHALAKHWQMIKEPNSLQAKPLWPNLL